MNIAFLGWRAMVGPAVTPFYGARRGDHLSSGYSFLRVRATQWTAHVLKPGRRVRSPPLVTEWPACPLRSYAAVGANGHIRTWPLA